MYSQNTHKRVFKSSNSFIIIMFVCAYVSLFIKINLFMIATMLLLLEVERNRVNYMELTVQDWREEKNIL